MIRTVVTTDQDGCNIRVNVYHFEVPSKDFDLKAAVMAAVRDYCNTNEGKSTLEFNCGCFNWGDFDFNVDNKFCQKYGFRKLEPGNDVEALVVDFNEYLFS